MPIVDFISLINDYAHCWFYKFDIFLKNVIIILEHPVGIDEDDMNVYYPGLVKRIASGDLQLIDVRNPDEIEQSGKIGNSYNIPGEVLHAMPIKPTMHWKLSKLFLFFF